MISKTITLILDNSNDDESQLFIGSEMFGMSFEGLEEMFKGYFAKKIP